MTATMHRAMVCLLLVACTEPTERPRIYGGDRPVNLQVPLDFDDSRAYPLVLVLHGYGANGFAQQAYFGLGGLGSGGDAIVLAPDGLVDSNASQFWNADEVCCDFDNQDPDDVAYLGGLVDDVMDDWPIDPRAVFAIGHSNGGFMSYRLACERSDVFAGIVVLAGRAVSVPCAPQQPVNVLHAHGTLDTTVPYAGAAPSMDEWAGHDGCTGALVRGGDLDLDAGVPGAETRIETTSGCPPGGAVELWSMDGAGHIPPLTGEFATSVRAWFDEHHR